MSTGIYDKTVKGRTEMATREFQLTAKLRTLLLIIDGKRPVAELFRQTQGLGLNQDNLNYLLDEGFITELVDTTPDNHTANASATPIDDQTNHSHPVASGNADIDEAKRLQALHTFFNSTIKNTLGLRGFSLQLKSERAASLVEFEALRRPYVEAVYKAKGKEMAISLRDRLDQLLFPDPYSPREPIIDDTESI